MANVWFCSDLHFGHKNIGKFRFPNEVKDEEHNRQIIQEDWRRLVEKKDVVYVLGDAAFTLDTLMEFEWLPGRKILVRGNHDNLPTEEYLKYFESVEGIVKYKEFWLTHAPIHPQELRGKTNLHGHVHFHSIRYPYEDFDIDPPELDSNYFNCCPENLWPTFGASLVSLDQIRKTLNAAQLSR